MPDNTGRNHNRKRLNEAAGILRLSGKDNCMEMAALIDQILDGDVMFPKKDCTLRLPTIEVYEYFGKNGGFAQQEQQMWDVRMIGINGKIIGNETRCLTDVEAVRLANTLSDQTGWFQSWTKNTIRNFNFKEHVKEVPWPRP